MRIDIITLFPGVFEGALQESILGRARKRGVVAINLVNLRDFATDKHRTVDDSPFGGGAGMLLKADILAAAVESVRSADSQVILLTPQGQTLTQSTVEGLARKEHLILVCGHYEGVDERFRQTMVDSEISLGDYILTSGNLAALIICDSVTRLLPGALGSAESAASDSFGSDQLLEYPQYTRPADFRGLGVPDVLLSGDHQKVDAWRAEQARIRTISRRPDIVTKMVYGEKEK